MSYQHPMKLAPRRSKTEAYLLGMPMNGVDAVLSCACPPNAGDGHAENSEIPISPF